MSEKQASWVTIGGKQWIDDFMSLLHKPSIQVVRKTLDNRDHCVTFYDADGYPVLMIEPITTFGPYAFRIYAPLVSVPHEE